MAIIQNRSLGHAVTLDVANSTYSCNSFAVPNSSVETVTGLAVTKILWTGPWTISIGSNLIFQTSNNEGVWDLNSMGISLGGYAGANLNVNTTSTTATLILNVAKQSSTIASTW
jgi:hypothetical protein